MSHILQNWYLREVGDHIRVTRIGFPSDWIEFLKSLGIPIVEEKGRKRIIAWEEVPNKYETRYDLVGNESLIRDGLVASPIIEHTEILMDFGYENPIIGVPVVFFIANWFRFIAATNFLGTILVTPDGSLFMEFTDDAESLLISNFQIIPIMPDDQALNLT